MFKSSVKALSLILALALTAAAQQPSIVNQKAPAPGFVSVIHAVDTEKLIEQLRSQQNGRVGVPGSAPPVIFHVTTGLAVDQSGHVVTRLAYVDPKDKNQRLSIVTPAGDIFAAHLVGVDFPSGFAVLSVESLNVALPKFAASDMLASGTSVQIQSADYVPQPVSTETHQAIRISPSIKFSQGRISDDSVYSKARGALTLRAEGLLSRNDSSIITTFDNQIVGMVQYAGHGRAFLFPMSVIRDTVIKRVLDKQDNVAAGWLGLTGESVARIPDAEASALGLTTDNNTKKPSGVIVREVSPNSPAANGGILPGDVIVGVDDLDIIGEADLRAKLLSLPAGQKIQLRTIREQKALQVEAVLGSRAYDGQSIIFEEIARVWNAPQSSPREGLNRRIKELEAERNEARLRKDLTPREREEVMLDLSIELGYLNERLRALDAANTRIETGLPAPSLPIGITTRDLSSQLASILGATGGVLVDSVEKGSAADSAGIKVGDVIIGLGRQVIKTTAQLKTLLASKRGMTALKVVREKQEIVVEVNSK